MDFHVDIDAAQNELERARDRILALFEWVELARWEQRQPKRPIFDLDTVTQEHLREDFLSLHDNFLELAFTIREALGRSDLVCTPNDRKRWLRRQEQLEEQIAQIRPNARFKRL